MFAPGTRFRMRREQRSSKQAKSAERDVEVIVRRYAVPEFPASTTRFLESSDSSCEVAGPGAEVGRWRGGVWRESQHSVTRRSRPVEPSKEANDSLVLVFQCRRTRRPRRREPTSSPDPAGHHYQACKFDRQGGQGFAGVLAGGAPTPAGSTGCRRRRPLSRRGVGRACPRGRGLRAASRPGVQSRA